MVGESWESEIATVQQPDYLHARKRDPLTLGVTSCRDGLPLSKWRRQRLPKIRWNAPRITSTCVEKTRTVESTVIELGDYLHVSGEDARRAQVLNLAPRITSMLVKKTLDQRQGQHQARFTSKSWRILRARQFPLPGLGLPPRSCGEDSRYVPFPAFVGG